MGEGQTSREFDDWCRDILSLPPKIEQVFKSNRPTFYNQCVVFQCLVNTTAEYVRSWWIDEFEEEAQLKSALEVGKQLLAVLKRGLQLLHECADEESREFAGWCRIAGCAGEFAEIIDDVKMYSQMMTGLAKEHVILELQPKVELDCRMMQIDLTCAIEKDTKFLIEKESSSLIRALLTHELLEIPDSDLEILSVLGQGTYGVVNKAIWRFQVPVAIKEFFYGESFREAFQVNKVLKATNSPHVLQTFGHTTLRDRQDRKGVVMELMDLDLQKLIELEQKEKSATPFSLYTSIDIMLQIGKGVKSLHELNVVHRDISPTNILVNARENGGYIVKLGELTLSITAFRSHDTHTDHCGRLMYMAPEMANEPGKYTRKVDVYSFGVVCIVILTGKTRRNRETNIRAMLESLAIPKPLYEMIHSCLETEQSARPSFKEICDRLWNLKKMVLIEGIDMQRHIDDENAKRLQPVGVPETFMRELPLVADDISSNRSADLLILDQTFCLGTGTSGSVWKAVWGELQVAVKKFKDNNDFQGEYELLLKLSKARSILQLLGHSEIEGQKALIMELMHMDLRSLIEKRNKTSNPFSLYESTSIMLQVAEGMKSLHEVNVIHRDIKPANILIRNKADGTFIVKVADLSTGKANFQSRNSNTGMKGTELYMAPEMVAGPSKYSQKKYSKKVDVYSFGLLWIEILTGKRPTSGMLEELKKGQMTSLLQAIPKDYHGTICPCLELEAQKRPTFEEICDNLQKQLHTITSV